MFRRRNVTALVFLLWVYSTTTWAGSEEANITLSVTGADPDVGNIMASLFDSAESYMETPLVDATASVDEHGAAVLNFGSHLPGQFAIVVFYDKNENGKLDAGFLRIPKEKVGFSNNAKGRFGPASWDDALFSLDRVDLQVAIELIHAKKN